MIRLEADDFDAWRKHARTLLSAKIPPAEIEWRECDQIQDSLLNNEPTLPASILEHEFRVPRDFVTLAKIISCHRQTQKWSLLYTLLWRITILGENHLLKISSNNLVHRLNLMRKAIRRDVHKMKAFVRFQLYQKEDEKLFVAWHEPDHKILTLAAPFFKERFAVQNWIIFTPDGSAAWNGTHLRLNQTPMTQIAAGNRDQMEKLWQTYYRATFNPARIKIKAMKKEMPVRFWKNLPETALIPLLLQEAPGRVAEMLRLSGLRE